MNMSTHAALQLAIAVAQRQRDAMRVQLHDRQLALHAAREQLSQLQSYATQSDARMVHQGASWSSMEAARHHFQFMQRLQQAMGLQTHAVERAVRLEEDALRQLAQAQTRVKALETLLQQRVQQARARVHKREQAATDEIALQAFVRRSPASSMGEYEWQ
ncbi:MAG: flagellar export protein FliJ [Rhodoferax sp.]